METLRAIPLQFMPCQERFDIQDTFSSDSVRPVQKRMAQYALYNYRIPNSTHSTTLTRKSSTDKKK